MSHVGRHNWVAKKKPIPKEWGKSHDYPINNKSISYYIEKCKELNDEVDRKNRIARDNCKRGIFL